MVFDTLQVTWIAALGLPCSVIFTALSCLFCFKKKNGFSNFTSNANTGGSQGHHNTTFTLEMPEAEEDATSQTVTIDPLPDISSRIKGPLRPRIVSLDNSSQNSSLKLLAHHAVPRSHLTYLKELGNGWFGKVIESNAEQLISGVPNSRVVVKMLKDDASKAEQKLFIEEVAPFREIEHTNVLRLLGECTEMNPMLMVLEASPYGDLKEYLRSHCQQMDPMLQKKRLIQFATDAACGLACLHRHDYVHKDLAARNCLVMGDHVIKIGDYGFAEEVYQEDYFKSGNYLLPIRWMAPETLKKENDIWVASNFSKESDIWSLGVLLWEIAMFGERPYDALSDKAVLQEVIVDKVSKLPAPEKSLPHWNKMYEIMQSCWQERNQRTKVDDLHHLLQQTAAQSSNMPDTAIPDFETKWTILMPNQRLPSLDSSDNRSNNLAQSSSKESELLPVDMNSSLFDALTEVEPILKTSTPFQLTTVSAAKLLPTSIVPVVEDVKEVTKVMNKDAPASMPGVTNATDLEFTDFTSYESADNSTKSLTDVSKNMINLVSTDVSTTNSNSTELDRVTEPIFRSTSLQTCEAQGPLSHTPVASTDDNASCNLPVTPFRPKPTPRKTSTPMVKESPSIADSTASTFATSPASASTTSPSFLTALASSQNTSPSEYYTTANNSTKSSEPTSGEMLSEVSSDSSYTCYETLTTTALSFDHTEDMGEFVSGSSTPEALAQSKKDLFSTNPWELQASDEANIDESRDDSFGEYTTPDLEIFNSLEVSTDAQARVDNPCLSPEPTSAPESLVPILITSVDNKAAPVDETGDTPSVSNPAQHLAVLENFALDLSHLGSPPDSIILSGKPQQEASYSSSNSNLQYSDSQDFNDETTSHTQPDDIVSFNPLSESEHFDQVKEVLSDNATDSLFTDEHSFDHLVSFDGFKPPLDQNAVSLDQHISMSSVSKNGREVKPPCQQSGTASDDFDMWSDFSFSSAGMGQPSDPFSSKGGMLLESDGAAAAAFPGKVGQSLKVECQEGGVSACESESSSFSTDSESSNSESSREYICEEPWEKESSSESANSRADSEEYALQIASEIYLSKGLKMVRSFETPSLEPIPEDPLPSISEESVPTPSETSSLDVKIEDVFEWDDFMGESLVGEEQTSDNSPKQSFDMPEWSLDTESESIPSSTSVHSQHTGDLRGSVGSDSHSTASGGSTSARNSHSDTEVTLFGRNQNPRSYISDFLANRTKGQTSLTVTSPVYKQDQIQFYSLFKEEFDLESDSASESSSSPGKCDLALESGSRSPAECKVEVNLPRDEVHPSTLLHSLDPAGNGVNAYPEEIALEGVSVTGDSNEPPGTSLLDLTALESADSGVTSTTSDTDHGSSSTPGTDGASLIDF